MNVLGVYEDDLSLFNGDLLDLVPAPVESDLVQDGLKSSVLTDDKALSLRHDVLALEQPNMGFPDPFDQNWLDTKVDVLDILDVSSDLDVLPVAPSQDVKPQEGMLLQDQNSSAIDVLQNVADVNMSMLTSIDISDDQQQNLADKANIKFLEMLAAELCKDDLYTEVDALDDSSILSPVTPEDIDTLLSSDSPSPSGDQISDSNVVNDSCENSQNEQLVTVDLDQLLTQVQEQQQEVMLVDALEEVKDPTFFPDKKVKSTFSKQSEHKTKKSSSTAKLCKEAKQLERKLRKKQQNKDAATRYRQKKRQEQELVFSECDKLETRNVDLKEKVAQMTREISYLKNLLSEIYEAKGILKKCK